MGDYFSEGFPHIFAWFLGAMVLGGVLAYGAIRSGNLKKSERQQLDRATEARQTSEDPQKP